MKHYLDHFELVRIPETDSTNTAIRQYEPNTDKEFLVVSTEFQTQGKGQRGNSWESERGKNLLFSLSFRPTRALTDFVAFYLNFSGVTRSDRESTSRLTSKSNVPW